VAIVLLENGDVEASVPMFLRASGLASHSGQFALPGGKLHSGEPAEAGALGELMLHGCSVDLRLQAALALGYVTEDEWEVLFADVFDQINAYAVGQPTNVVNPAVLSHARL